MPPHTAYFTNLVTLDVSCQHADPCCSSSKGPLSANKGVLVEPVVYRTQRKSVSFNEVVKAKKTIHIADFSAEEIRCCWYKDDDYEVMKRDVRFEANLLENDCLMEKQSVMTHTTRGLEMFTSTAGRVRRETKRRARNAVLEEQRLQREEGSDDPEFIAEIYTMVTKAAIQIAITAAC